MWFLASALALGAPPSTPPSERCSELVDIDTFREHLDAAWEVSDERAREELLWLERQLPCLAVPLRPADAAMLHRVEALDADRAGDQIGARAAARAARRLHPEEAARWAEQSERFGALLGDAPGAPMREEFGTSLAARVVVDGGQTPARTVGEPIVVQIFSPAGRPIDAAWVDGRSALPDWVVFPPFDCDRGVVGIDALLAGVARAEAAYVALDVEGFETALAEVGDGLPCLSGRIGIAQAAALHLLEGIRLFTHGAEAAALRSFQEAQALDPSHVPPEAIMRPSSTLAELWARAGHAAPSPWRVEPVPSGLAMVVDGLASGMRPAVLPSIVQLTDPQGRVLWTRYVPPGSALPSLAPMAALAEARQTDELPPALALYRDIGRRRKARTRGSGLALAGIGLLTASAALYVDNSNAVLEYRDPETLPTRLGGLERRANLSATGSSVLLVAGSGLVIASLYR